MAVGRFRMSGLGISLLVSLGLTLFIELTLATFLRFSRADLVTVLLVNIVTNPLAVLLYTVLHTSIAVPAFILLIPIELLVFFGEGLTYRLGTDRKHPFLDSILLNAASCGFGLLINLFL